MPILDKNNKEQIKKYKQFLNSSEYVRLTQTLEWGKVKNDWIQEGWDIFMLIFRMNQFYNAFVSRTVSEHM